MGIFPFHIRYKVKGLYAQGRAGAPPSLYFTIVFYCLLLTFRLEDGAFYSFAPKSLLGCKRRNRS
jgi:hypothetical protein